MTLAHALSSPRRLHAYMSSFFIFHFTGVYGEPDTGDDPYRGAGARSKQDYYGWETRCFFFLIIVTFLVFHGLNEFK
jgi:hypothetical protein